MVALHAIIYFFYPKIMGKVLKGLNLLYGLSGRRKVFSGQASSYWMNDEAG